MNQLTKICTGPCGLEFSATTEYFYKSKKGKYGLASRCKKCMKLYHDKDDYKDNKKAYNKINQDKIKAYRKIYAKANKDKKKEYDKIYNETNRKKIKKYNKIRYELNKNKIKIKSRIYYEKNKNEIKTYSDIYRKKNKDKIKIRNKLHRNNIALYNSYVNNKTLIIVEKIKRDPKNLNLLQVKCAYCNRWFNPTISQVTNRIGTIKGRLRGENRLYCSDHCKQACPIFQQVKYPKGFKKATSREVQPELRQMVLARDDYTCQKCGVTINQAELHCHHITGIVQNPLESADLDNCVTLCKACHKQVHKLPGCGYHELRCVNGD